MRYYQIKQIHRFNGGVYYFEKCPKSTVFFQQAQKIASLSLTSCPTINDDEIIYGITNELTKIAVVYPNKDIAQSIVDVTDENICVLKGECAIFKKHQWQNPAILCFNSGSLKSLNFFHLIYLREKLKLSSNKNIADFLYTSKLIILFIPWIPVLTHYFKKIVKFILGAKIAKKIKELAG
ncbi:hypothetical protein SPONN_1127 [uncultured Candidatus Thioglobus sp.]|nr:hypothetical protein SPONN_1127 [uncultured Candidatus Thioglobus sp.]